MFNKEQLQLVWTWYFNILILLLAQSPFFESKEENGISIRIEKKNWSRGSHL